jgi:hypothetical protein
VSAKLEERLDAALGELCEAANSLLIAVDDAPVDGRTLLVDRLADAAQEFLAGTEEATAALAGETGGDGSREPNGRVLACHRCLVELRGHYESGLATYERLSDMSVFASERGRDWPGWARALRAAIADCRPPLDCAFDAVVGVLAETHHADAGPVTVHSTAIGHVSLPSSGGAP